MPEDFYFAYDFDGKTASRLYRYISSNFERYDPIQKTWRPDPEQSRIFIGEDVYYDEITAEQASQLTVTL